MPWTHRDAERHNKAANTEAKQRQWAEVANTVLKKYGDEGRAIRTANAAIAKRKKRST